MYKMTQTYKATGNHYDDFYKLSEMEAMKRHAEFAYIAETNVDVHFYIWVEGAGFWQEFDLAKFV